MNTSLGGKPCRNLKGHHSTVVFTEMTRVLIVEDDDRLGRQIQEGLRAAGFEPEWARRGDEALAADSSAYGLIILDLMLPGAHGFDVLKALRREHHHVPVLVLSARQDASDRIRPCRSLTCA